MTASTTLAVNRPPAITWHRLQMNETAVQLAELPLCAQPPRATVPAGASVLPAGPEDGVVGISGLGEQAESWLSAHAATHTVLEVPRDTRIGEPVVVTVTAQDGTDAVATLDLVAREGSEVQVVLQVDGAAGRGVCGTLVRLHLERGAQVGLRSVQTLPGTWTHLDGISAHLDADARLEVDQTFLGGDDTHAGLAVDLAGDRAACHLDVHYLGSGERTLDLGYIIRQRGRHTDAILDASGVLTGSSSKTFRGTIDLVHGCKGSVGHESEEVLILDERAENRTLPVILCDEDDVQGDHGASIGHVDPAQLGYLQARGLSTEEAEKLFLRAVFDRAVDAAPDEGCRSAIRRLAGNTLDETVSLPEGA